MTVLHLNTSTSWGGLEQYTIQFITALREVGVHGTALVVKGSRLDAACVAAGIPVLYTTKHTHLNISALRAIRRFCKQHPDAIVHSHTRIDVWSGSLAVMGTSVPHVNTVYMIAVNKRDLLHRIIYGRVNAIVSTSGINNDAIRRGFPIPADRIHLIRYMRDPEKHARRADARIQWRKHWLIADDALVIGMAARIDPQKGVREFVGSFPLLSEDVQQRVHYVVIGEPSMSHLDANGAPVYEDASAHLHAWLLERVSDPLYRGRLHVLPFQRDLPGVMSAFDVFVLATYHEMYALSVVEAMLNGLPVIATLSGGTPEQIAEGRGRGIEPQNAQALAQAIIEEVENDDERRQHAEAGRQWAIDNHDPRIVMRQWLDLYHSVQ